MDAHKNYFITYVLVFVALSLGVSIFNYKMDPYQFFHVHAISPLHAFENSRFQNPGLARNLNYDTVFLGSSMADNFRVSELSRRLGINGLKLSASGSHLREQIVNADFVLRQKKAKTLVWCVDLVDMDASLPEEFPSYLYDADPFTKIQYLLNVDTLFLSLKLISPQIFGEAPFVDLDLVNIQRQAKTFDLASARVALNEEIKKEAPKCLEAKKIEEAELFLQQKLLPLVMKHPNIQIKFYFPPYSDVYFHSLSEKGKEVFDNYIQLKNEFVNVVGKRPNVRIYDFQNEEKITHDFQNYFDFMHYSEDVNYQIFTQIFNGQKYLVEKSEIR